MHLVQTLQLAIGSLRAHKLRVVLTFLGVVIGVATVITVLTLVEGANAYVNLHLNHYGADVFTVAKQPAFVTSFADYSHYKHRKDVTIDQYRSVLAYCSSCSAVGAAQATIIKVSSTRSSMTGVTLRGWTESMFSLNRSDVAQGRSFTTAEEEYASHVAVVGSDIATSLLVSEDPLGREIRIDGVPYTVIGVFETQGKTLGVSQDNVISVPLSAYQRSYSTSSNFTIYARAHGTGPLLEDAVDEVRTIIRTARRDSLGSEDSFTLDRNNTLISLFSKLAKLFGAIALPIAALSLLISGIGIMNIMLVSVTERGREIGIRKALGARKQDIIVQFLFESSLMSTAGGICGIGVGLAAGFEICSFATFPFLISWWSVALGIIAGTSVGIFFGVYPARRAAMLDPIAALRNEA